MDYVIYLGFSICTGCFVIMFGMLVWFEATGRFTVFSFKSGCQWVIGFLMFPQSLTPFVEFPFPPQPDKIQNPATHWLETRMSRSSLFLRHLAVCVNVSPHKFVSSVQSLKCSGTTLQCSHR